MKHYLTILLLAVGTTLWAAPPRHGGEPMLNETYNTTAAAQRMAALSANGPHRTVGFATTIPRVLVIMTNFSDFAFVSTKADMDSMFNAQNWTKDGATGSIRQYFYDQSNGAYNPQFDVVGPVTLSKGYAYYGAGRSITAHPSEMVVEACALVNDSVDFTQYDSNGDGNVDLVYIAFAGFGENDPPTADLVPNPYDLVWPHYSTINTADCGSKPRVFDGKTIQDYECANELDGFYSTATRKVVAGIGVMVHEFCHGLGLPDLYNTRNQYAHKTWGEWDIMDYGPYNNDMHTPPSLSAYERYFLGWLTPTLLNTAADITLESLATSNTAGVITLNGQQPTFERGSIYWMVENRQKNGWDRGIPGSGLLLSQIKAWSSNGVNNDKNDMKIDLLEADGITAVNGTSRDPIWYGKQGDLYPYGDLDSITVATNYPITDITKNADGTISFKVCGGRQTPTGNVNDNDNDNDKRKFVRNGQIYIRKSGKIYTILGHETNL